MCLNSQQKEIQKVVQNLSISSSNESTAAKIKLPPLQISKFNGDRTTWQSFWDQFNSAFHSNDEISDINKFNYLHSYLCDSAIETISGLSPTSTNITVELLRKRYGNTQALISSFMNKFVTLEKK